MKRIALGVALLAALSGCTKREGPSVEAPPAQSGTVAAVATETSATSAPAATETVSKEAELASKLASYSATRLDGTKWVVGEQKGKALLLNVWATWCGPCRYEIPELKKMQDELGPKGFEVVGIAVDEKPDNQRDVAAFVDEKAIQYPVVLDPDGTILLLLETSTVPTTVLLDRQGNVVWYSVGIVQATNPALVEALEKALAPS